MFLLCLYFTFRPFFILVGLCFVILANKFAFQGLRTNVTVTYAFLKKKKHCSSSPREGRILIFDQSHCYFI